MSISPPAQQQMVPPGAFLSPEAAQQIEGYSRFMGILRDVRAEVQNLRRVLVRVQENSQIEDASVRAQEVLKVTENRRELYTYNKEQIDQRLRELRSLIRANPVLYDRYGDEVTHIENFWERATQDWPPPLDQIMFDPPPEGVEPPTAELLKIMQADVIIRRATDTIVHLDGIIYHAALLTIPGRLNQHLEQLRIGQKLDFDATFSDEVDRADDRRKILEYLSARPMVVRNGIIDVANGVVFHASSSYARRRLSYLYIALAIVVGALLALIVANMREWFGVSNWPIEEGRTLELVSGYAFVILGGVIHLGVDGLKQARAGQNRTLLAIEDWLLWIHIHEVDILMGVFSLWVGFFGLLTVSPSEINWETAFFIGYSIDSFIDLFLQRFDNNKHAAVAVINQQTTQPKA